MMQLGALEILGICIIIGSLSGIYFRDKSTNKWIGIVLGIVGAIFSTYLFSLIIYIPILGVIIYSVFGGWLFNLIFKKINTKLD